MPSQQEVYETKWDFLLLPQDLEAALALPCPLWPLKCQQALLSTPMGWTVWHSERACVSTGSPSALACKRSVQIWVINPKSGLPGHRAGRQPAVSKL
jgi:hypothetical protein